MANVQVRDVPEEVHAVVVRRAERAGQSLQQYLAGQLELIATTPTSVYDVLERVGCRSKPTIDRAFIVEAIREGRARR